MLQVVEMLQVAEIGSGLVVEIQWAKFDVRETSWSTT